MSRPTRTHARGKVSRPRRQLQIEAVQRLEDRQLLAPYVATNALTATFTAAATPTNPFLGTVQITQGDTLATSAAAFTSVSSLALDSAFGGDMVRIQAGPGGDFGKAVYAISRGAGTNTDAIDKPGVIYRVDPTTGKSSVFFDLNTVLASGDASNSFGAETGLVNWYDITFDPEGYFDGRTSMFVSSVDRLDPTKNVIFRIGSDGSFLGAFVQFTEGGGAGTFSRAPSAIYIPPVEQQAYLRGLFSGDASSTGTTGFAALYFDSNSFRPGTDLNSTTLPTGVTKTSLTFGPQTGFTSTSTSLDYNSLLYSTFTNFGDPGGPNSGANPGLSGVQGLSGELLIGDGTTIGSSFIDTDSATPDTTSAIITPYRRFMDTDYDKYGYFSYGATVTAATDGGTPTVDPIPPDYVGSLFVADLSTGLTVSVTPVDPLPTDNPVIVPVQSDGALGVTVDASGNLVPIFDSTTGVYASGASNLQGGRIVRIAPDGTLTTFAEGFNTSSRQDAESFADSSLSLSFSADGTILYVADDDGIWQFKSVLDLADSSSGTIIGLSDLRSLGVPYDGQDSAVAVVDTGIDANTPSFAGRVANGYSTVTKGKGNDDTVSSDLENGHGTLIAGAIAQFVPQATLVPVNAFTPNTSTGGTTSKQLFNALYWLTNNTYTKDPVRPGKVDRIITTAIGFGTTTTFETEGVAYGRDAYPQIVLALKGVARRMRVLGNQAIAAAGQFGIPAGSGADASDTNGDLKGEALPAVLNEVLSVTGSYSFPFTQDALSTPNDASDGTLPRPAAPLLISGGDSTVTTGDQLAGNAGVVGAGDQIIFADRLLASANRTWTTDYAAPAVDVPTFRRTYTGGGAGYNVFQEGGTSLSAGVLAGSYAMVASALDYWDKLAESEGGVTSDAYLNTPVGTRTLAFGSHKLVDLSAYSTPDGVNSILEWTAVPAEDETTTVDTVLVPELFGLDAARNYARVDVGNAIAAIEGSVAINYLLSGGYFDTIDSNKDGSITAQEVQTFTDNAATLGMPEAGAMARLLGGTTTPSKEGFQATAYGETPDQPDVLQRRFNFFDYSADEQLNGMISIAQLKVLAKNLLPAPDAFTVTDRQRSSNNQFLVDSHAPRNYYQLQHLLPTYVWVPKRVAQRYSGVKMLANVSRKVLPSSVAPTYDLFEQSAKRRAAAKAAAAGTNTGSSNTANTGTKKGKKNSSTTSTTSTGSGSTTGTTGTTSTTVTTSTTTNSNSQAIVDALKALASGTSTSKTTNSTTGGTPAGTTDGSATAEVSTLTAAEKRKEQIQLRRQTTKEKNQIAARLGATKKTEKNLWEKVKDNLFGWMS